MIDDNIMLYIYDTQMYGTQTGENIVVKVNLPNCNSGNSTLPTKCTMTYVYNTIFLTIIELILWK